MQKTMLRGGWGVGCWAKNEKWQRREKNKKGDRGKGKKCHKYGVNPHLF